MSVTPTPDEIRAFLTLHAAHYDGNMPNCPNREWGVPSVGGTYAAYPDRDALLLAELCLLTGQPLSDVLTVQMQVDTARRLSALEAQVALLADRLNKKPAAAERSRRRPPESTDTLELPEAAP